MGLVAGSLRPSRGRRFNIYFSTGDVLGTYWAGILGGRPWIRMYVARHQKEQELCAVRSGRRRSGFVVELRISSAAAN